MNKKLLFVSASFILLTIVGASFSFAKLPSRNLRAATYGALNDPRGVFSFQKPTAGSVLLKSSPREATFDNLDVNDVVDFSGKTIKADKVIAKEIHAGGSVKLGSENNPPYDWIKSTKNYLFVQGNNIDANGLPTKGGAIMIDAGNVYIDSNDIQIGYEGDTSLKVFERNNTNVIGSRLNISAGDAKAGSTNTAGGDLTLSAGRGMGTGGSSIYFQTTTPGLSGSANNILNAKMTILGNGNVGIGTVSPQGKLDVRGTGNILCLPNGAASGQKCFKAVCPAANGQWTLSETATCGAPTTNPSLAVSIDVNTPPAKYNIMGSSDNTLFRFTFKENNVEDVRITDLAIRDNILNNVTSKTSFVNFRLYNGATLVGGPGSLVWNANPTTGEVIFSMGANGPIVPQNGSLTLTLKADVASFSSGGAVSNSKHTFELWNPPLSVTAIGRSTNLYATISGNAVGNEQSVYRTKPTITASTLGLTSFRVRSSTDDLATVSLSADPAFDVSISKIQLKFQGMAVANGTTVTARLIDTSTGADWSGLTGQTCVSGAGNSCSVSFNFSTVPTITQGSTKNLKLRLNSMMFNDVANAGDSLSVVINASGDFLWGDGTTTNIPIETFLTPLTIASISYE